MVFTLLDALCVVAGYGLAEIAYFHDKAPAHYWDHFLPFLAVTIVLTLVSNHVFGLYGRMWRHAGAEEARQLVLSAAVVLAILIVAYPVGRAIGVEMVPVTVVGVGCMFATSGMGLLRFHSRLFAWQRGSRRVGLRVAVVGSRDAGAAAIREMLRSPGAGLVPVAVFDDDPRAHGLSMMGVPVVGSIDDIPQSASRYTLQQVLLTIPEPPPELVERVLHACETAGLTMKVLPGVKDLVNPSAQSTLRQAREPRIEDLLGRTPVPIDLDTVRRALHGRRVLVTGAGGSIGSEICRQVAELDPTSLVLLDHDETHLHDTAASLPIHCEQALVDVTDRKAVFDAFERYLPEVVFHAAAHKHVPVLENHPIEATITNVFGTLNVVEAAIDVGTQRFVQISTDKAVRPSSVMGASKRLAEQIVLSRAPAGASYCTVRFGNVLGSRGSVIPTFARQIAAGGPVTVTDARMTRFFMSVHEAVQLVLESSVLSDGGGEIFMLEMGKPVRILDLAERMIRLSGYQVGVDIPIHLVGMRPGEKLEEELRTPEEEVIHTQHPYINQLIPITAPAGAFSDGLRRLEQASVRRDPEPTRALLFTVGSAAPDER
ncbi:MAG: polysaccharide biosynthesis protein, partial [Acidimicrobiales bacterium]|nr:polysaccharide biosynthesis protein [Acidimicrobiales bacterium]